jgi:hypothetical protein
MAYKLVTVVLNDGTMFTNASVYENRLYKNILYYHHGREITNTDINDLCVL